MVPKTTDKATETQGKTAVSLRPDRALTTISEEYPELSAIVQAWPTLPEAIRAGILAMITAARKDG